MFIPPPARPPTRKAERYCYTRRQCRASAAATLASLAEQCPDGYGRGSRRRAFPVPMYAFLRLVDTVIQIYIWLLIAQAVLSWLVAFGVVNRHNRAIAVAGDFLWRITEPLLRPIRRVLPDLGGIDISPVILILLLFFLRNLLFEYLV
jgi:YggT family protein